MRVLFFTVAAGVLFSTAPSCFVVDPTQTRPTSPAGRTASADPSQMESASPVGAPAASAAPISQPRAAARPDALRSGDRYCCGNEEYRLEIGCGYLEMRCYENGSEGWRPTYGRHCREQLGQSCYLNGCDDLCR